MIQYQLILFILCLEILFTLAKNNKVTKNPKVLGNTLLYTAYADGTTFFLKNVSSIKEILNTISLFFSSFSGLKLKLIKVARIRLDKG